MNPADDSGPAPGHQMAAPGWYPDPSGAPLQRYWDGMSWSGQTAATHSGPAPAAPRRKWVPWAIAAVCALLLVVLLVVWINRPGRQGQPGQPGQGGHRTTAMAVIDYEQLW